MNKLVKQGLLGVIWIVLGLGFICQTWADSTFVSAGNIEGVWNSFGSPYVVQGNLTVLAADSLTIEPGVRVYFAGAYSMLVNGYIAVDGMLDDSVVFTTDTLLNPTRWRGLSLSNANDSSFVRYTIFENSRATGSFAADSLGGALLVVGGTTFRVEHSRFHGNTAERAGGGLYVTASTLLMDSCELVNNSALAEGGGLYLNNSLACSVTNTKIFGNNSTNGSGGGVYVRGTTAVFNHCTIDSNHARRNGGGIMFSNSPSRLDSSEILHNHGQQHGGGISLEFSPVQMFDCLIDSNYTTEFDGGGIYIWESSPHMLRCRILNNHCADDGAGIHNYRGTSNGLFQQCEIRGNVSGGEGGGIWVTFEGAPTFEDCIVRQNSAASFGGGVHLRNDAHPTFVNCDFDSNSCLGSGGGFSIRQSQPIITNCRIRQNVSNAEGGGIHLRESAEAVINSCDISGNFSISNGGGVSTNQSTLHCTNCLITKNGTSALGGGIATANSSKINLLHCTIGGSINGGIRLESTVADIENTIVAMSSGSNLYFDASSASRIAYSLLQESIQFSGGNSSEGPEYIGTRVAVNANGDSCDTYFNLYFDPEFVDTAAGNWGLTASSPAIGAGNWNTLANDLLGNSRPQPLFTLPDMGALENSEGFTPAGLFGSISGVVGPGTVKVVADVVVEFSNSLTIAPGTTLLFCGPSSMAVNGVVSAIGLKTDSITFTTDTLTNPGRWRGMTMSDNAGNSVFDFVSISDSRALTTKRTQGGAIRMSGVSPILAHSTIRRHEALLGGAISLEQSSPAIESCLFVSNSADSGGAIYAVLNSNPVLDECILTGNSAFAGGAYLARGAGGQLLNCRIENNTATSTGGAVSLEAAPALLRNCLLLSNSASTGGAIWLGSTNASVEFCTISKNTAVDGAGIYTRFGASQVRNSIIADNNGDGIFFSVAPTSVIQFNCVAINDSANFAFFGNSPSQGPVGLGTLDSMNANGDPCDRYRNIQLNPQWTDGIGHDYYLSQIAAGQVDDSPCVNAADPLASAPVGTTRTDYVDDILTADQGYHGPQLIGGPVAVNDLVIRASTDSLTLTWSYSTPAIFAVKTDSLLNGSFFNYVAVTSDTFVVLPMTAPINLRRGYFHVVVEP